MDRSMLSLRRCCRRFGSSVYPAGQEYLDRQHKSWETIVREILCSMVNLHLKTHYPDTLSIRLLFLGADTAKTLSLPGTNWRINLVDLKLQLLKYCQQFWGIFEYFTRNFTGGLHR